MLNSQSPFLQSNEDPSPKPGDRVRDVLIKAAEVAGYALVATVVFRVVDRVIQDVFDDSEDEVLQQDKPSKSKSKDADSDEV